ncbi:MAG: hypothetical protein WCI65_04350 [Synechococcaceae cyanobacterium ELA263]
MLRIFARADGDNGMFRRMRRGMPDSTITSDVGSQPKSTTAGSRPLLLQ